MPSKTFDLKDLYASFVLRIETYEDKSRGMLGLSQIACIDCVLKRYNMNSCSQGGAPIIK